MILFEIHIMLFTQTYTTHIYLLFVHMIDHT